MQRCREAEAEVQELLDEVVTLYAARSGRSFAKLSCVFKRSYFFFCEVVFFFLIKGFFLHFYILQSCFVFFFVLFLVCFCVFLVISLAVFFQGFVKFDPARLFGF